MNTEAGPSRRTEPRKKKKKAKEPNSGPIPAPYLALAPSPVSSISRTALNDYVAPVNNRLVLPSTFARTKSTPDLRDAIPPPPTNRRMYAANLTAPPLIMPGGTSATPRIQELGAAPARRGGRRRSEEGLRGMAQANQSMASLGVLGRIMENDLEPRRRRRVVREERQMPVVASREEGRALGLARGASMRRLSVWDDLPDTGDAPPPFVPRSSVAPDDPAPPFIEAPRSPPPSFEQATAPSAIDLTPIPEVSLGAPDPSTVHLNGPPSRPTSILSTPSSPETHYASAPESPVETASEDEPDEREDRRAWNADISAGYSFMQRVQREAQRRRVSREAREEGEGVTGGSDSAMPAVSSAENVAEPEATDLGADESSTMANSVIEQPVMAVSDPRDAEVKAISDEQPATPSEPISTVPITPRLPTGVQSPPVIDAPHVTHSDVLNSSRPVSSPAPSLLKVASSETVEATTERVAIPANIALDTGDEKGAGLVSGRTGSEDQDLEDGEVTRKDDTGTAGDEPVPITGSLGSKDIVTSKVSPASEPPARSEMSASIAVSSAKPLQAVTTSPVKDSVLSGGTSIPTSSMSVITHVSSTPVSAPILLSSPDKATDNLAAVVKADPQLPISVASPKPRQTPEALSSQIVPVETPMLAPVTEEDGTSQVGSDIAISPTPTRKLTRGKAIRRSSSGLSITERRAPESPRQPLFDSDWRKAADLPLDARRGSSSTMRSPQSPTTPRVTQAESLEASPALLPHREAALKRRELMIKLETPPKPELLIDLFSSKQIPYHSPPPVISPDLYELFEEPVAESSAQAAARIEQEEILAAIQKAWSEEKPPKRPSPPPPPLRRTLVSTTVGANLTPRRSIIRTADSPVTPRPIRQLSQGSQDRPVLPTRRPPPPPPKDKDDAPPLPPRPAPTYTRRDSAFSGTTASSDSQPVRPLRPKGPRPPPPNKRWGRIFLPAEKLAIRPSSERTESATVSHRPETVRSLSEQDIRSPIEYTDLDVLVSRLEGSGREYEGFSQITAFLGPGKSPAATPEALATLLPSLIFVDSRRVTGQGKVKLKLSLLGVRVTKCPICLGQFKKDEKAVLLPECGHVSHEDCARKWFREDYRCFVCRVPLLPETEGRREEGVI